MWGLGREQRQIRGYHILEGASPALHYSRDEQSAPLRAPEQVYESIREDNCSPDATRKGYFRKIGTVAVSAADPMLTSARQIVDDSGRDPELQEGRNSLPFCSTVCVAPPEELTEVKYEIQPPMKLLWWQSLPPPIATPRLLIRAEEWRGLLLFGRLNRPVVTSPPAP